MSSQDGRQGVLRAIGWAATTALLTGHSTTPSLAFASDPDSEPPPPRVRRATGRPGASARTYFVRRCASCHGARGLGNGPAAAALNPRPRSFADPDWQKERTDDRIARAIVHGGPAVGLSVLMPSHPDLEKRPKLVQALVRFVRSLGPPGAAPP